MKDIFYKTTKWILLTIGASVITIFVQGVLHGPQTTKSILSADTNEYLHFSYEKTDEMRKGDVYDSTYLLRLIGSTATVADRVLFVYPGEQCSKPKLVIGTGDIAAPHYAYEWRYAATCETSRSLHDEEVIFSVI